MSVLPDCCSATTWTVASKPDKKIPWWEKKTKKEENLEKNQTRKITKRSLIYKQFQGLNVAWTKMTNILNGEEKNKKEEKRVQNECNVKLFRSIFNWALELNSKTQLHRMNECNAHLWTMWKTSSRYFCAFCPYHFGIEQTHWMAIAKQSKERQIES